MANRPANAGAHSAGPHSAGPHSAGPHSAGPHQPMPRAVQQAMRSRPAVAPPSVRDQDFPRSRMAARAAKAQAKAKAQGGAARPALAWLPYLIVLAGALTGLAVAWLNSLRTGPGAGVVGVALLVAALARLVLPPRYAGLLVSRSKAMDVAGFAVLGIAVLAVAASLP
jgi:hypothetical protein